MKKIQEAIKKAIIAEKNAYTPITKHNVGACIITKKGNLYQGSNVQSVISGLGNCAERAAIDNAITNGEYLFETIVIVAKNAILPCGACLQYLAEFSQISNKDIKIISADKNGKIHKTTSLNKQLKTIYGPLSSNKNIKKYQK